MAELLDGRVTGWQSYRMAELLDGRVTGWQSYWMAIYKNKKGSHLNVLIQLRLALFRYV